MRLRRIGVALGLVALASAVALAGFRLLRSDVLPGASVVGTDVGGHTLEQLEDAVAELAARHMARPVSVSGNERTSTTDAAALGYRLDGPATVEAVWERGRQSNPVAAFADHVRATLGRQTRVEPVQHVAAGTLAEGTRVIAAELAVDAVEGGVRFEDGTPVRVDPEPGLEVRTEQLAADLEDALLSAQAPVRVDARIEGIRPETTADDVDALWPHAERAVSAPVSVSRQDTTLTLTPAEIGEVLTVAVTGDDPALELVGDADALVETLGEERIDSVEGDPVDADFSVSGGTVQISESAEGFRFDADAAAEQIAALAARADDRSATLEGEVLEPDRTTEDAEALGIVEQVASFTTEHACCESRVTNIQLMADLVDGVVLEPGESLSLNDHVGRRTTEKGFEPGGAILDGEFIEDVGGGVSQFATTLYNAAYFGGYELAQAKPHSYYIGRYPPGREATLDYPHVDLVVRNNSPNGLLVTTSHTGTSVTVSLYGTQWVEVESVTGERHNVREPETEYRENDELDPGEEREVQAGREGFDITDTRVLRFPDGRVERQERTTRYQPEPRVIERNTADPDDD